MRSSKLLARNERLSGSPLITPSRTWAVSIASRCSFEKKNSDHSQCQILVSEPDVTDTFSYVTRTIRDRFPKLAYIHIVEPRITGDSDKGGKIQESNQYLRDIWSEKGERPYLAAGGFTKELAEETIDKHGGGVVFGRYFVANPDLPVRRHTIWIPFAPKCLLITNGYRSSASRRTSHSTLMIDQHFTLQLGLPLPKASSLLMNKSRKHSVTHFTLTRSK